MKIKGKLTFKSEREQDFSDIIARSLAPDNVPDIQTIIKDDSATIIFEGEKVGTILSSVDDYLMNVNIALSLSYFVRNGQLSHG